MQIFNTEFESGCNLLESLRLWAKTSLRSFQNLNWGLGCSLWLRVYVKGIRGLISLTLNILKDRLQFLWCQTMLICPGVSCILRCISVVFPRFWWYCRILYRESRDRLLFYISYVVVYITTATFIRRPLFHSSNVTFHILSGTWY